MIQKITAFDRQYQMLPFGGHILAGVSGGADSVCLLLLLKELRESRGFKLTAVHIEHGIRGEDSLKDAAFVEALCQQLAVDCRVYHLDAVGFSREYGMTLEEGARELRYRCFEEVRREIGADRIAVAHNQNDCGETLLFHLARGTGLKGMCGIAPVRGNIIRPLLCVSRQEIEDYLAKRGQAYCTDATNQELQYSRNKIRHQVLPALMEINSGAVEHLYQSTRYVAEAVELVEQMAKEAGRKWVKASAGKHMGAGSFAGDLLILEKLSEEPPLVQATLMQNLLAECAGSRKDISGVHVNELLALFTKQVGRSVSLPYGMTAVRTYGGILLTQKQDGKNANQSLQMQGQPLKPGEIVEVPALGAKIEARILEKTGEFHEIPQKTYTKWFDCDKIKDTLLLRTRAGGDYFQLDMQGRRQSLGRYFINEKIPARRRDEIPVLAEGDHILWIIGYRISEAYKVTEETKRILEVQVYGGNIHE